MTSFWTCVATGLFAGFSPLAPGTVGSALGIGIVLLLPPLASGYWLLLLVVLFLLGSCAATRAEEVYGHDASRITIDEVVGMLVAVTWLPEKTWLLIAGFILFRIFDIFKPYPIHSLQALPRGWGVMADDLCAGIYTNILLQIAVRVV